MTGPTQRTTSATHRTKAQRHVPKASTPRYIGFTLVELLTVIVIISLLMGILMPTFTAIIRNTYVAKTADRVRTLDTACQAWRTNSTEGNYGRYPAQGNVNSITGELNTAIHPTTASYSGYMVMYPNETGLTSYKQGSQLLALNIFFYSYADANHYHPEYYVKMTRDMLDCPNPTWSTNNGTLITKDPDTILDLFPKPKPILYYVSNPTKKGVNQFSFNQNPDYMNAAAPSENDANFRGAITNQGISTGMAMPYRAGEYLIIGSGISRTYFIDEDITNFNKQ